MSAEGRNKPMLRGWTSVATRLLDQGGPDAWFFIDDAMSQHEAGYGSASFVEDLRDELSQNSLTRRMKASRTADDAKVSELLEVLRSHPLTSSQLSPPHHSAPTVPIHNPFIDSISEDPSTVSPPRSVRGDRSMFLGREVIQAEQFECKYPRLSFLLQSVVRTVSQRVASVEFDTSMTSVQLAEYPGDGVSGYPRHLDRDGAAGGGRVVTAIYYLTPEDWDVRTDGGCLRLFDSGGVPAQHIAPYSNRLVIFRSDGVEHQVLPSLRRPRLAITIWMYGQLKQHPPKPSVKFTNSKVATCLESGEGTASSSCLVSCPPPLPVNETDSEESSHATIFVSIPAYRDSETGPTVRSLMSTARNPSRVFVGLVLQVNSSSDDDQRRVIDLLPTDQPWYLRQVRVLTLEARHATGPCNARVLAQSLFRGEDYVLSIDSHMRFRNDWDVYLIQQLRNCPSGRPVLSTYPVGYELPNRIPNETRGTLLEPWKFDDNGMFRQKARFLSSKEQSRAKIPIKTHLFAAGFNFATSSIVVDCPYQNLPYLFFGEESSMAVRLFVRGYDVYAPIETVCYHLWSRANRSPPPTEESSGHRTTIARQGLRDESMTIVQAQLTRSDSHAAASSEALVRDVPSFGAAIGVDFQTRTITTPS